MLLMRLTGSLQVTMVLIACSACFTIQMSAARQAAAALHRFPKLWRGPLQSCGGGGGGGGTAAGQHCMTDGRRDGAASGRNVNYLFQDQVGPGAVMHHVRQSNRRESSGMEHSLLLMKDRLDQKLERLVAC